MTRLLMASLIATLLMTSVACTSPMDTKITKENYSEVVEKIRKNSTEEEWKKVAAVMMLAKLGGITGKSEAELMEGKSFNEIIKNIKEGEEKESKAAKEREEKELKAAKDEADHAAKLTAMFEEVNWTKGVASDEYGIRKVVRLTLKLKNKTEKDLEAFEGRITVYDKLQNKLGAWNIKHTDKMKAGKADSMVYEFPTMDFRNNVKEIYNTKGSDLKFKFEATKVLLADGSTL